MLNQLVLVGRITHDPKHTILEDGRKVLKFQLAVQRAFKNYEGTYDTDFISVTAWEGLTKVIEDYVEKGAMLAVKGRVQSWQYDLPENKKLNMLEVVADKVTYLSSSKKKLMEELEDDY